MKKRSVTLADVARKVGVSTATISHVINESRYVSEDLKQKVYAAIEELEYYPNEVARGLRTRQTFSIGLIIPNNTNPFYAEVVRGVEKVAFQAGYSVIMCNSDRDIEKEIQYTQLLIHRLIDGIILVGAWVGDRLEHLEKIIQRGVPMVVVDRLVDGLPVCSVLLDNELGGKLATRYLLECGHRRIACIGGSPYKTPNALRVAGYLQAMEEAGITPDESIVKRANFSFEGGRAAAHGLLAADAGITAIFAGNDLMAIGAMRAAQDLGLAVPNDLSIIGFDNIQFTQYTNPPLTTIEHHMAEMGGRAMEMLLNICSSDGGSVTREVLQPELVLRESTAKPGR